MVDFVSRSIDVRCLPGDIPAQVEIDISGLHVGQHIEVSQLPLPENVELVTPPTETICTVYGKKAEEEEAVEAEVAEEEAAEAEAGEQAGEEEGE
jgi:large subunit ribosomal protein L25